MTADRKKASVKLKGSKEPEKKITKKKVNTKSANPAYKAIFL